MKIAYTAFLLLLTIQVYGQSYYRTFDFSGKAEHSVNTVYISIPQACNTEADLAGFDFGTESVVVIKDVGDRSKSLYSDKPFYFSAKVPEGNYKVTILYRGLRDRDIRSTVRSESRRLHLENVTVKKKKRLEKSFTVHIKDPLIESGKSVGLKPGEADKLDWDDKLTLEFQGENNIQFIRIEAITSPVTTVFLAGNSTVVNQEYEPWASWGQMIPRFFNTDVAIANYAESGLSLGSFLSQRRLDKILSVAKPGDYLFVEFGHNDQKEKGVHAGAFKSYTERLQLFVNKFREKGGYPVIVTPTARRRFDEKGIVVNTLGDFPDAARQVAAELQVPLVDLNQMTTVFYRTLGEEDSKKALVHYPANSFPNQVRVLADNTHFNPYGAYQISKMVLQGIRENKTGLAKKIIDFKGFDPTRPDKFEDWHWPLSLENSIVKPDGD